MNRLQELLRLHRLPAGHAGDTPDCRRRRRPIARRQAHRSIDEIDGSGNEKDRLSSSAQGVVYLPVAMPYPIRLFHPEEFYLLTNRCQDSMLMLRPDPE
ncbi:MAG: hypothetical protein HY720_18655, partial [Planctomycetes bacterium]|nr:hypothetical protein [Planctomycetota bacterium]